MQLDLETKERSLEHDITEEIDDVSIIPSRLLKKSSAACSPSVISPASGRGLKEGSPLYRRVRKDC
jgi:hypothetical protein